MTGAGLSVLPVAGLPEVSEGMALGELVAAHAERCVWASNWPHPNIHPSPSTVAMLDLLLDWAPDEATRCRILIDNPARLYGF